MTPHTMKVEIVTRRLADGGARFYFRIVSGNGAELARSGLYTRKNDARQAVEAVKLGFARGVRVVDRDHEEREIAQAVVIVDGKPLEGVTSIRFEEQ